MVADGYKDTEIGVIPIEWDVVKIVEVLDLMTDYVANGSFASLKENTTVYDSQEYAYYVRLFDLRKGLGHSAQKYVDKPTYDFLDKSFLEGNEILIANIGANVGESFLMPTLDKPSTLAPNMIELKLNYEKMTPLFCFNYLKSNFGLSELDKVIEGSGQPKINKTKLKTIKIPLPPLKEQEKIADILSTADDKIDAIASQIKKAETLKKGLLQKLLSKGIGHSEFKDSELGKIPASWEVAGLGKIANITKLAGYEFTEHFNYDIGGDIIALRALNVVNGILNLDKVQTISEEISNKLPRSKLYINDILMTYVGTLGEFAIIEENDKFHLAPNVAKITMNSQDVNISKYILFYLMSHVGQKQIKLLSTTTSQPAINMENIRKINIPLPPLEEQKQIANILSTADEKLEVLRAKKEKYETLKKGLLQKLLSGEVRVN